MHKIKIFSIVGQSSGKSLQPRKRSKGFKRKKLLDVFSKISMKDLLQTSGRQLK
jgi:hypothetical protein